MQVEIVERLVPSHKKGKTLLLRLVNSEAGNSRREFVHWFGLEEDHAELLYVMQHRKGKRKRDEEAEISISPVEAQRTKGENERA